MDRQYNTANTRQPSCVVELNAVAKKQLVRYVIVIYRRWI